MPDQPERCRLTDEVALTSILRNLLSNAIKYTDSGEVRLSTRVTGPRLEISVADTGIGIPAGLQAHVFEEFCTNGRQALAIIAENPVGLVLADMRMPGMDGGALPASVPAIIVTSADGPAPPRAAALLCKDELTRERLEFTIRGVIRSTP
jgi:CheY-like chemotaxis protein